MSRTAAPVLLGNGMPISPSSPSFATISYGKAFVAVELLGRGRDLVAGEVADRVAQQALLV